jgi:hypothetical protein
MIFRAIFWIGLVALLMPHEPDLGLGRPGEAASALPQATAWAGDKISANLGDPASLCRDNAGACTTAVTLLGNFKAATVRSLAAVKADIAQNGRAHLQGSGS